MIDDWFRTVELKITWEEFERLPRTLGYKHEYYDGRCVLSPRPRSCYAVLDLRRFKPLSPASGESEVLFRQVRDRDWPELGRLCGFSFDRVPPFSSLTDEEKVSAGMDCMAFVRKGGDGPFFARASVVAADDAGRLVGALLVVLKPPGFRRDPRRAKWKGKAPPASPRCGRSAQPHLDWVFVAPFSAGRGIASAMLAESVAMLRQLSCKSLTSSFLLGNGESMAWHWRNGFKLLTNPASQRQLHLLTRAGMGSTARAAARRQRRGGGHDRPAPTGSRRHR